MSNRNGKKGNSSNKGGSLLGKKPRPKKSTDGTVYVRDDAPRRSQPRQAESSLPQTNKRLGEVEIDRLGHDGRGVAQLEGKTLFVAGALAGERVTARLVEDHSRFTEARVDQVLRSAPERIEPPCPHYASCGGCQLQHMQPTAQLAMKQQVVLEQLQRWGGVVPKRLLPLISVSDSGYRNRARLGVWYEQDGSVTLGFRQQNSKSLTNIKSCLVLAPALNQLLTPIRHWLTDLRATKAVTHIELVNASEGAVILVRHTKTLAEADIVVLAQLAREHACAVWLEPNGNRGLIDLNGQAVDPRLVYTLEQQRLQLSFHPQDFTQVNPAINELMVSQALELLALKKDDSVLDFFCGIGNFTLPIAKHVTKVTGIEGVDAMVERGCENARNLAIENAHFLKADLANLNHNQMLQLCREASAILLDPPRDGAKELVVQLKEWRLKRQLKAQRIVYVSCNPATLARDAGVLVEAGYSLEALGVLDMFPHTSHVESMALFLL